MTATVTFRTASKGLRPRTDHVTTHVRRSIFSEGPPTHLSPRSRTINARELLRFECVWPETNRGQKSLLEQAWRDSYRGALPMNYTPVGELDADAIEVQFDGPISIKQTGPQKFDMRCKLVEVR